MPTTLTFKKDLRPYGASYKGHPVTCDCERCAEARAERIASFVKRNADLNKPKSADATVFVRAHFRRQKGHLRHFPHTRELVMARLKQYL
jgi:hypothetical protein